MAEGPGFEPGLTESDGVFGRSACPSWGWRDEIDLMIELHQCKERQEAIKRADKAGEGIAKFMYEGRLYKMEWISKWDPRNHSYLDPFQKNHGERHAYWSEP
jgi:hypothetical protein